jgi:CheY-like chemotaxis protein
MSKIMLVEDDNNLREIYEARLLAEGYEIITAHDGEEALALAVKEKPDLIISDVMMPKISGFDMLDILRSTPETKDTKVIMMTALSQAEDKSRADSLGADRYLVKSQVTLEDVAKIAREVLEDGSAQPAPATPEMLAPITPTPTPTVTAPVVATPIAAPVVTAPPIVEPVAVVASPVVAPTIVAPIVTEPAVVVAAPAVTLAVPDTQTAASEQATVDTQINSFVTDQPVVAPKVERVVQPLASQLAPPPDLNQLVAQEERSNLQASTIITPSSVQGEDPNLIAL